VITITGSYLRNLSRLKIPVFDTAEKLLIRWEMESLQLVVNTTPQNFPRVIVVVLLSDIGKMVTVTIPEENIFKLSTGGKNYGLVDRINDSFLADAIRTAVRDLYNVKDRGLSLCNPCGLSGVYAALHAIGAILFSSHNPVDDILQAVRQQPSVELGLPQVHSDTERFREDVIKTLIDGFDDLEPIFHGRTAKIFWAKGLQTFVLLFNSKHFLCTGKCVLEQPMGKLV